MGVTNHLLNGWSSKKWTYVADMVLLHLPLGDSKLVHFIEGWKLTPWWNPSSNSWCVEILRPLEKKKSAFLTPMDVEMLILGGWVTCLEEVFSVGQFVCVLWPIHTTSLQSFPCSICQFGAPRDAHLCEDAYTTVPVFSHANQDLQQKPKSAAFKLANNLEALLRCCADREVKGIVVCHLDACWISVANTSLAWAAYATKCDRYSLQPKISCSLVFHESTAGVGAGASHFSVRENTSFSGLAVSSSLQTGNLWSDQYSVLKTHGCLQAIHT